MISVNNNNNNVCTLRCVCVFQGFVSFLLPCFAVDHLYLSYDEYLFSEEETPISEGKHTCSLKAALVFSDNTHCTVVIVVYCGNQLTYMYVL